MFLKAFRWNRLYAKHPPKRAFAKTRIEEHYKRFALAQKGVVEASVRYVSARMPFFH
jgi:hypothetical protein